MTATTRLDAIEARANAATTGPWEAVVSEIRGQTGYSIKSAAGPVVMFGGFGPRGGQQESDATLAAAARADVPALVAALRGVMEVHAPLWTDARGWRCQECDTLLTDDAPDCPTVATITAALTEVTA